MKQKLTFAAQVFSTLILFLAVFITYLERDNGTVTANGQAQQINEDVAQVQPGTFFASFPEVMKDILASN